MDFINIIGTLFDHSMEHVVALANQIKDLRLNKNQQDINEDIYNKINNIQRAIVSGESSNVPIGDYPKVWFLPARAEESNEFIMNIIESSTPKQDSYFYTNTVNTNHYYVIVESGHSLVKVVNNSNFEYTSQFIPTDIDGYKVYHYQRVIGTPVTWTFTVN